LLVSVPEGSWNDVRPTLLQAIDERTDFFRGAKLILQMEDRQLGASELGGLRDALDQREIVLTGVLSTAEKTRSAGADLGLALEIPRPSVKHEDELEPIISDVVGEEAALIRRTLRSGQTIRHPGHVVILGDVNPGAEVVAGGNVVVWGRLRGVVHAGASGREESIVCALDLAPTQLRIGAHISVSPERKGKPRPEMAYLRDEQFVAESWKHN
jgi:septum site-determining protein MinC